MKRSSIAAAFAAVTLGAMTLTACETATPYQPFTHGADASGGYRDERIDAEHFRVTFRGNSLTSRATVENYLLYRAAELTAANGFDWFETVDHHTDTQQRTFVEGAPFDPYWRFWGPGYRGRGFWGGPFWDPTFDVQTVERFDATADIVVGHGPKPPGDARAFDARQVMANLGPHIKRPGQK
ncbi:MAG TPA: hypothetical protein VG248_06795 [Caulobacteraceae bacterium]|jgi:hypothetical protein|nr:hypothetical protein [Caulobacteraceae bacterium]